MKVISIVAIVVTVLIFLAIIITVVQISNLSGVRRRTAEKPYPKTRHVVYLNDRRSKPGPLARRYTSVAAVTRNATNLWTFACFASVILVKWIVTAASCRRAGYTHRAILYRDFAEDKTHAFPIMLWRLHEKYNSSNPTPKYDIAVAKLNMQGYKFTMKPAVFNRSQLWLKTVDSAMWKTVSTVNKEMYLTDQFDSYKVKIGGPKKCFESYGVQIDESLMCIDTSIYRRNCFTHDFGPLYLGDRVVGTLVVKPMDCDMPMAIFTNISYYATWILKTTSK